MDKLIKLDGRVRRIYCLSYLQWGPKSWASEICGLALAMCRRIAGADGPVKLRTPISASNDNWLTVEQCAYLLEKGGGFPEVLDDFRRGSVINSFAASSIGDGKFGKGEVW